MRFRAFKGCGEALEILSERQSLSADCLCLVKIDIAKRFCRFKIVAFYASGFRGGKAVSKRTVIGNDEKSFGIEVEPPDREKLHCGKRRRQQFHDGAVQGVGGRSNNSRRFIQHEVTAGAETQFFSVAEKGIAFGVKQCPCIGYPLTVEVEIFFA